MGAREMQQNSKIQGSLSKAASVFVCSRCLQPPQSEAKRVRIGDDEFERVDEFCYLGHTLEASGRIGAAVRARIKKAWMAWKKLAHILTRKELDKRVRGTIYTAAIRSTMLYTRRKRGPCGKKKHKSWKERKQKWFDGWLEYERRAKYLKKHYEEPSDLNLFPTSLEELDYDGSAISQDVDLII